MKFVQTTLVFALSAMSAFAQAQQSPSILGKTDLHALLEAAPGVPNTPAEAAKRAEQSGHVFPLFYQRTTDAHELIKQGASARAKGMPDQVTLEAQARAQSNSNPIVAGMGGIGKLQQMTPEQRKAAAQQSMAAFSAESGHRGRAQLAVDASHDAANDERS